MSIELKTHNKSVPFEINILYVDHLNKKTTILYFTEIIL